MSRRARLLVAAWLAASMPLTARAATITIINGDGGNEGFNDPTPVAPVGGNPGNTLGAQRLYVFQFAANLWGSILPSNIEIRVQAAFDPITNPPCTATSGVLGSTGTNGFYANFTGAPMMNIAYNQALANKLSGVDQNAALNDMSITFNSDVDNGTCLGSSNWYYGVDGNEGTNVELLAVVLHEMGHGLGFTSQVSSSGAYSTSPSFFPSIYSVFLLDDSSGLHWNAMSNAQRATAYINTGNEVWDGPAMNAQTPVYLQHQHLLTVTAPAVIAGDYRAGTPSFGPDLTNPVVTAPVVQATDGVADLSLTNACTPILSAVAGKIALIDRGGCTFVSKVQAAQDAGAVGAIIADSLANPIALDLGGASPTITIPSVGITMADANLIKGQLAAGVTATIGGSHPVWLAGADLNGRARVYAPNPAVSGSSISHFDVSAIPNLLMEPSITNSITAQVDLTRQAFRDMGWFTGSTITGVGGDSGAEPTFASAPNPFDGATTVSFRLARPGPVDLDVFGVDGRHLRRLVGWPLPAGTHSITWNGRDEAGRLAPAGVYLIHLHTIDGDRNSRVVRLP